MRYFRLFLGLLCLLGFATSVSAEEDPFTVAEAFTVNPSTTQDLGTIYVGETTHTVVSITNVGGVADSFTDASMSYGALEINGVTVGLAASISVSVTAPGGSPIPMTAYTQTISTTDGLIDEIWLQSIFSGSGTAIAKNGTLAFDLAITPKVAGLYDGLINFFQSVAFGLSPSYEFTLKAVNRPSPPPRIWIKPYVRILLDQPDMSGAVIRVPAHLIWGGDEPVLVLDSDYSKITWKRNGQVVATGKDPWLELADGDTVTVSVLSTDDIAYTSMPEVFRVVTPPPPPPIVLPPPPSARLLSSRMTVSRPVASAFNRQRPAGKPAAALAIVPWGALKAAVAKEQAEQK